MRDYSMKKKPPVKPGREGRGKKAHGM